MQPHVISRRPTEPSPHPPLLFVHGMWHGAWCWDEHFLPYFAGRGFEAHALDLRGHGDSRAARGLRWTRISDYVDDVVEVASGLGRSPVLIGHSMGGFIVQHYLGDRDAPAAVLLASVPPAGALGATLRVAARHPLPFLACNLTLSMRPIVASRERARAALFSPSLPIELLERYHARLQDDSYRAYLGLLLLELPRPAAVRTRVLVVGAGDDRIISREDVGRTASAMGVEPIILPGVAHDVMLEPGWESAAKTIADWLEGLAL